MSNDNKTLADVQPGGMVRLGDQAERARFEAWAISRGWSIQRWAEGIQRYCNCDTEKMWEAFQAALSAQPSPGGQDALDCIGRIEEAIEFRVPHDIYAAVHGELAELKAALAARQPVVVDLPESLHDRVEALREVAARQPVGEPVAWMTHHDEPMLFPTAAEAADYCEDDEQPVPLFRSPAQAVDLGPASIPDTPEVRHILGRPNFWCSPWANVLRMRGDEIPNKAEEEQAAVIRFMLNHYLANGTAWAETAGAELDAIRKVDSQAVGNG